MTPKERAAIQNYMAVFGQALEAHSIPYTEQQVIADKALRKALDHSGEANEMVAEQAEQGPVLRYAHTKCPVCDVENPGIHECAAPVSIVEQSETDSSSSSMRTTVRTKDLTDDEIGEIYGKFQNNLMLQLGDFARAVIAADREKNK